MRLPFTSRPRRESEPYRFPLNRSDQRTLDPAYDGVIATWDIDKTYLRSDFQSVAGMLRVPFEFAIDKQAIPGTIPLLKALRRGPGPRYRHNPIYFVSASPPQLRTVIERKMLLDGVEFDGITFKDWGGVIRTGHFSKLKNHIGFKLSALLLNRRAHPIAAKELLFGDDSESDALIYSTYAAILRGDLRGDALVRRLEEEEVDRQDAEYVRLLSDDLPVGDQVLRAFIHLETHKPPESFAELAPLVVPSQNPLQAAVVLRHMGQVDDDAPLRVAWALATRGGMGPSDVAGVLEDAGRRGLVPEPALRSVRERLAGQGLCTR